MIANQLAKLAQITGDDLNKIGEKLQPIKLTPGSPFSGDYPLATIVWNIVGTLILIAIYGFLLAMLVGGIQYLASGGNDETIGKAKKTFTNSIIGMIVVLASYQILSYIINKFGPAIGEGNAPKIVARIFEVALGLGGTVFIILLMVGGVQYLTAGGNDEQVEKAKKLLKSSLIGIMLIAFAYAIGTAILLLLQVPIKK